MRAVYLNLVLLTPFVLVSLVGCNGVLQRAISDGKGANYALGDTPSERSTPRPLNSERSLEELTVADTISELIPPDRNSIDGHHITVEEIELQPDSVSMDTTSDPDRIAQDNKSQLPPLLENADHPFSKPGSFGGADPVQTPPSEYNDHSGITLSLSDEKPLTGDDSVMRFKAEPAADPRSTLPKELDAMFTQADPAAGVISDHQVDQVAYVVQGNQNDPAAPGGESSQPKSGQLILGGVTPRIIIQEEEESLSVGAQTPASTVGRSQPQPVTWEHHLEQTIRSLDTILESGAPDAREKAGVQLRLLRIVANDFDQNLVEPADPTSPENEFWNHQLKAVNVLLNQPRLSDRAAEAGRAARTAGETRVLLEKAIDELGALAPLKIRKYAFCSEITGFGQFTPVSTSFAPGQRCLVYCELDNYGLREETVDGQTKYHAEMRGEYMILNSDNRVVYQYQYQPVHDEAQSRRHDFYMYFPITLPKSLVPDTYRLQLSIEDMIGQKGASTGPPLTFRIDQPGTKTASQPNHRSR